VSDEREDAAPPPSGIDLAKALLAQVRTDARARSGGLRPSVRTARGRATENSARSGAGPDDRDPQPLGRAVDRLRADRGWEEPLAAGGVLGRWAEIVGPDLAAHCAAESMADGVLTVRAESTAWATQIRLLAPVLVRRLNEECGQGTVARVLVLGPGRPSWRKGRLHVRGRGPRDTYG
jgi:predicted nucleic acid-binding Zn ribbon protein